MSRLPAPDADAGVWGDILNDFLRVEHNEDGTLRSDGSLGTKAGLNDPRLSNARTPTNHAASHLPGGSDSLDWTGTIHATGFSLPTPSDSNAGTLFYLTADSRLYRSNGSSWTAIADLSGAPSDASSSTKGVVQLSNDLGGIAAAPTVTATHLSAPLPVAQGGTGSATQSWVDLTNDQTIGGAKTFTTAPVVPAGAFPESAIANLPSDLAAKVPISASYSSDPGVPRMKVVNSYTINTGSSNQTEVWTGATLTGWTNEWGGYRCRVPDSENYDAGLRIIAASTQTGKLMQVQNSARTTDWFFIDKDGSIYTIATLSVGGNATIAGNLTVTGNISAANLSGGAGSFGNWTTVTIDSPTVAGRYAATADSTYFQPAVRLGPGNFVYLRGRIDMSGSTQTSNDVIASAIGASFTPSKNVMLSAANGAATNLQIGTNGKITNMRTTTGTYISLDGLMYSL